VRQLNLDWYSSLECLALQRPLLIYIELDKGTANTAWTKDIGTTNEITSEGFLIGRKSIGYVKQRTRQRKVLSVINTHISYCINHDTSNCLWNKEPHRHAQLMQSVVSDSTGRIPTGWSTGVVSQPLSTLGYCFFFSHNLSVTRGSPSRWLPFASLVT
jgi:hypothetical protein